MLNDDVAAAISEHARAYDLVVLGLGRAGGGHIFGQVPLRTARETSCTLIIISRNG